MLTAGSASASNASVAISIFDVLFSFPLTLYRRS